MAIWDDIAAGITGLYDFITVTLIGIIVSIKNAVFGIPDLIGQAIGLAVYPVTAGIQTVVDIVNGVLDPLVGFVANVTGVGTDIQNLIVNSMGVMLDAAWIALILTGVTIIVGIRVYHFLKDIEIVGNKI